jgi:acetyltransferase-like isoleucine patch superfamily enzyme
MLTFNQLLKAIIIRFPMNGRKRARLVRRMRLVNKMGKNCFIGREVSFGSEPELITLGNNVWLTARVRFITHDGSTHMLSKALGRPLNSKVGEIIINDNCFIGIGSLILPNVTIFSNSIVGAGSIVTKDVPENTIVAGNPAREIMKLDDFLKKNKSTGFKEILSRINSKRRKKILELDGWKVR